MSMAGLRQPSALERYQLCRVKNEYYSNFNITVKYHAGQLHDRVLLSNALKNLVQKHPILGCNYFRTNENLGDEDDYRNYVVRGVDIDYEDLISKRQGAIDGEYFEYLNSIFFQIDVNQPLWKLIVVGDCLTIVCCHVFLDGNGGVFFHQDLMAEINNLASSSSSSSSSSAPSSSLLVFQRFISKADEITSVPPSVESSSPLYRVPWWFALKTIASHYMPWFSASGTTKFPLFKTKPVSAQHHTKYRVIRFDKSQTASILSHVKKQKLTFTPWLIAQVFTQLSALKPNTALSASIPLNGRRYYPELDRYQVCVGATEIKLDPPFPPSDTTSTANQISQQLRDDLETRVPFYNVGMLLRFMNVSGFLKDKIGKHGRVTLEVSNVGRVKGVREIWFGQDNGLSTHMQFDVASGDDAMNIVVAYVDEVANDVERMLPALDAEFDKIFKE
ncbi:uncharacterized protein LODBEIA_P17070 [Lodderomyces beijingensis]|uniref:Alcohol acetyltransferase n=1 Tax=Lodderomyces beijingensis TaxID=1775926 RepID=A0ABP0ZH42_9ASCO